MIALAGFWIAAAMSTAEPPLRAANDNQPMPLHGGEHEPAPHGPRSIGNRKPNAASAKD